MCQIRLYILGIHEEKRDYPPPPTFNFLNLIKGICRKPKTNIIKQGKILKTFFLREENVKYVHFHHFYSVPQSCMVLPVQEGKRGKQEAESGTEDIKQFIHKHDSACRKP